MANSKEVQDQRAFAGTAFALYGERSARHVSAAGHANGTETRVIRIPQPGDWSEEFCLARARTSDAPAQDGRKFEWYCGVGGFQKAPPGGASRLNIVKFRNYARAVARGRELDRGEE